MVMAGLRGRAGPPPPRGGGGGGGGGPPPQVAGPLRRNSGSFLWFFLLLPKERTTSREAAVPGSPQRHVDLILDGKAVDRQLCHRYGQPLGKCAAVEP